MGSKLAQQSRGSPVGNLDLPSVDIVDWFCY